MRREERDGRLRWQRVYILCLLLVMLATICGCSSDDSNAEADIIAAAEMMMNMESLEYVMISDMKTSSDSKAGSYEVQSSTEHKLVMEPFCQWTSGETINVYEAANDVITRTELYMEKSDSGLDSYSRMIYTGEDGELVEDGWEHRIMDDAEQAKLLCDYYVSGTTAMPELIKLNAKSFSAAGSEELNGKKVIMYDGVITPESAAQVFIDYMSETYAKIGFFSAEVGLDAKTVLEQVRKSDIAEMQTGIPSYMFATKPIPVSLFLDSETKEPVGIILDKKDLAQELLDKSISYLKENDAADPDATYYTCDNSTMTIEIKSINKLSEIPAPETIPNEQA